MMFVWKWCLCGTSDEPESNGIVGHSSHSWSDLVTTQCRVYWPPHTRRGAISLKRHADFLPHSKTNILSLHYTCMLYLSPLLYQCINFSCIFSTLLHSTLSFFLSTVCCCLSLHLFPAMSLCRFIIHGVVLMVHIAMSDVNLCASKAHPAWTASASKITARATLLRYHTRLNQHYQSHLNHTVRDDCVLLFTPPHIILKVTLLSMWQIIGLGDNCNKSKCLLWYYASGY